MKTYYAKEFDSKYEDSRDINQKEKEKFINKKCNMLPIHEQLSKLDLNKIQMDVDGTSLYASAMWDKNSVYLKIETGYTFKPHMNDVFVNYFNYPTFIQNGNESAILKIK